MATTTQPIIIPGLVRSGTSQVAKAIYAAGIGKPLWLDTKHSEAAVASALNKAEYRMNVPDPFTDGQAVIPFNYEPSKEYIELLCWYKRQLEARHGKNYAIKEPGYGDCMRAVARVWPEAKYVVCVRDSVSIGRSQFRRGMNFNTDLVSFVHYGLYALNLGAIIQAYSLPVHFVIHANLCCKEGIEHEQEELSRYLGFKVDLSDWVHKIQGGYTEAERKQIE